MPLTTVIANTSVSMPRARMHVSAMQASSLNRMEDDVDQVTNPINVGLRDL